MPKYNVIFNLSSFNELNFGNISNNYETDNLSNELLKKINKNLKEYRYK